MSLDNNQHNFQPSDGAPEYPFDFPRNNFQGASDVFSPEVLTDETEESQRNLERALTDFLENGFEAIEKNASEVVTRGEHAYANIIEHITAGTSDPQELLRRKEVFSAFLEMQETTKNMLSSLGENRERAFSSFASLVQHDNESINDIRDRYKILFDRHVRALIAYEEVVESLELFDQKLST